jgi:DNA-binding NarL/FixJ family response regulator
VDESRLFLDRVEALLPVLRPSTRQIEKARSGGLTGREREVAELVARGLSNRAAAEALFVSERTIEKHIENLLGKLGFTSRAQIATWITERKAADRA